jgi:polygalacturonase
LAAITGNLIGSQTTNIHLRHARGIVICGNSIYSGAQLSLHAQRCRHVVVGGNTFDHNPGQRDKYLDGIRFEDCYDCTVTGSVLEDSRYSAGAISMKNCRGMAVTGCQILDPEHAAVALTDCHRCRISDNSILDRREPPRMKTGISVTGNSAQNLIQSNMIQKGTAAAIAAAPEAAAQQGNMIL